ncbi:hypothetical protein BT96DRAFT_1006262 [Gymnopus androsaceus JB14]|uniref:Haloacid dehalogenase n=1 Tax=Gymnopus androsaceus JB14 TaxID=1447944 RepID=A0A6A4GKT9_9AGAR|nr:hypothetical protein BT96DRAFT_1006262 [Gymnopus androsaceus JB14]
MSALKGVEVLLFDVFGTVVDWQNSITKALEDFGKQYSLEVSVEEWQGFADEWRILGEEQIAQSGGGPNNVVHREVFETTEYHEARDGAPSQILDQILSSSKWSHVGKVLDEEARAHLTWRRMNSSPDAVPGLYALKNVIVAALSNMNMRLLAKHADLPWDAVSQAHSLILTSQTRPPTKALLLTYRSPEHLAKLLWPLHAWDLRGAAKVGLKTVYVTRPQVDLSVSSTMEVKSKAEGEFDVVAQDFQELARLFQ